MKTVNLISLLEIYKKNNKTISQEYMKYLGTEIKEADMIALKSMIEALQNFDKTLTLKDLNSFYMGYKIPQIGKEFDLLRLTSSSILNIEYKTKNTEEKIKKQLIRNRFYLNFLGLKLFSYTYIQDTNKLYKLDQKDELTEVDFEELILVIKSQGFNEEYFEDNLDTKFNPTNYLISPFSKTDEFISNQYFLTQKQEDIEKKIYSDIGSGIQYIILSGEAGSGKTLLTYHIAKNYINKNRKVGLIHCGKLNGGHFRLKNTYKWNIESIKDFENIFKLSPEMVIIDEFQRINKKQFTHIIKDYIKPNNIILILSGDGKQILDSKEGAIFEHFQTNEYNNVKKYKLNTKIRTNEKLANFIKVMLSLDKKNTLPVSNENINITYFNTIEEANLYIKTKAEYDYVSYTPSMFYGNKYADLAKTNPQQIGNSHEVIGQEFENVIAILGEQFYYDGNNLKSRMMDGIPYWTSKMFFQQITRAINKLEIVVVNNKDVFDKLIGIFN